MLAVLLAPSVASACTASAFLSGRDGIFQDWSGNAVGCNSGWTYSWRIRWYHNGNVLEEHINENKRGSTYYSTPSYHNTELYSSGSDYSVTFFIYHSSTVGNNLVDKASDTL
ncbi:MAG TPA: hypothetical protein VN238_01155 [Solirubrobacteraceae bacterium]|nr:hypothetical protein [Solirubrobacteraceae bacterium]